MRSTKDSPARKGARYRILVAVLAALFAVSTIGNVCLYRRWRQASSTVPGISLHYQENLSAEHPSSDDSGGAEYKALFIGNSITLHPLTDYWWGEWGMAASDKDHDYVHLTAQALSDTQDVSFTALNFGSWETMGADRAEALPLLDSFLEDSYDLVVIQLGENASDTSTFADDYEDLIQYIRQKEPDARVLVIGEFWQDEDKDAAKRAACENTGATFIDLSSIQGETYQAGLDTTVSGDDGRSHAIERDGVARHPGDKGQAAISVLIIEAIRNSSN